MDRLTRGRLTRECLMRMRRRQKGMSWFRRRAKSGRRRAPPVPPRTGGHGVHATRAGRARRRPTRTAPHGSYMSSAHHMSCTHHVAPNRRWLKPKRATHAEASVELWLRSRAPPPVRDVMIFCVPIFWDAELLRTEMLCCSRIRCPRFWDAELGIAGRRPARDMVPAKQKEMPSAHHMTTRSGGGGRDR